MKTIVFSRTLRQQDHPNVTIVADNIKQTIDELRAQPGKDIWLFGGGKLFCALIELDCVDTIEPAVIPVILGDGIPMYPRTAVRRSLELTGHKLYQKTGTMLLRYAIKA
jgi:dihydrofolate reductase